MRNKDDLYVYNLEGHDEWVYARVSKNSMVWYGSSGCIKSACLKINTIQYKIPRANSSDAVNDTMCKQKGVAINKLFII